MHSGEADSPKQVEKYRFLDAMERAAARTRRPRAPRSWSATSTSAIRTLDIHNWKGNVKRAGFLPEERAYFDRFLGAEGDDRYNYGAGFGWVDLGRRFAGEVPGLYSWWSWRGKAFDNDAAGASTTSSRPRSSPTRW